MPASTSPADRSAGGRTRYRVGDIHVDVTTYDQAAAQVLAWARGGEPRYVCVACANNVVLAADDADYALAMRGADLVTSDGVPIVWLLRLLGAPGAERVYGPRLTEVLCAAAAEAGVPVGFYGGSPDVLPRLVHELRTTCPGLDVRFAHSPPFRPLDEAEESEVRDELRRSGASVLFVGLGAPKQERWMARNAPHLPLVCLGVGAAFDFLAGEKSQAPAVLQRSGLEWLFRLTQEPGRLWRRYLIGNPRFLYVVARQLREERASGPLTNGAAV